ncbi:MAG: DUF3325 family protein [Pseudomonadota bacterium]
MIHVFAIVIAAIGFLCLASSMRRHAGVFFPASDLTARRKFHLRLAGTLVLASMIAVNAFAFGVVVGLITWFGQLTIAAAVCVLGLQIKEGVMKSL